MMKQLDQIRCFLLDMDGTFYLGNQLLPGALEFIALLERGQEAGIWKPKKVFSISDSDPAS